MVTNLELNEDLRVNYSVAVPLSSMFLTVLKSWNDKPQRRDTILKYAAMQLKQSTKDQ